jgi:hypothetical protein
MRALLIGLAMSALATAANAFPFTGWNHVNGQLPGYTQWHPKSYGQVSAPAGWLAVDRWANQVRYQADVGDHWQTPIDTIRSGTGDCEDIAILKYTALRSQHIHSWLVLGLLRNKGEVYGHAAVMLDDGTILNNHGTTGTFTPQIAFDDNGAWYLPAAARVSSSGG